MSQPNDHVQGHRRANVMSRAVRITAAFLLLAGPSAMRLQAQERALEDLRRLNQSVDALIRKVSPSVVQILVTGYGPLEEGEKGNTNTVIGRQRAIGSGFVIEESGYIVTTAGPGGLPQTGPGRDGLRVWKSGRVAQLGHHGCRLRGGPPD